MGLSDETFCKSQVSSRQKNLTTVPMANSVTYDSLKLGTTCQVYKAVNLKIFSTDDSAFIMEAEDMRITAFWGAENEKGGCQPVEYFSHSGCGNSYERFLIPQKHYLIIAANYLHGDFKTKLRLKLRVGKNVYHSSPLQGSISKSQFILSENFYSVKPLTEGYKAKRYSFEFLEEIVD